MYKLTSADTDTRTRKESTLIQRIYYHKRKRSYPLPAQHICTDRRPHTHTHTTPDAQHTTHATHQYTHTTHHRVQITATRESDGQIEMMKNLSKKDAYSSVQWHSQNR